MVLAAFMLSGGPDWRRRALGLMPSDRAERIDRVLTHVSKAVSGYVTGAMLVAFIAGLSTFIVLTIMGAPFAAPLAVVAGLFSLVPLVGATIAAVLIGIVTLFSDFPTDTILWTVWAIVYQQIENNLIQPQVQKRTVNVNGFIVLVSVLFGATLLGVLGAMVAIPIAASIQIVVREWWEYRRETRIAKPAEPPPPPPAGGAPRRPDAELGLTRTSCRARRAAAAAAPARRARPASSSPAALELGVQLGAEQDRDVRDPQPDQEHDHAAQGAVGLVVGAEVRDVERERGGCGDPRSAPQHAAGGEPAEARLADVGRRPVEDARTSGSRAARAPATSRCPKQSRPCCRPRSRCRPASASGPVSTTATAPIASSRSSRP